MLTRRATELEEFILNAREPVRQLLCFCEHREQANLQMLILYRNNSADPYPRCLTGIRHQLDPERNMRRTIASEEPISLGQGNKWP